MPEQLWITAFLNKHFAGLANSILGIFHLHAAYPRAPIPNYVAMQLVVFVLIILFLWSCGRACRWTIRGRCSI